MGSGSNAAMIRWLVIGTVLQLIMIIAGHYNEFIAMNVFALGGMTISLIAGAGYGPSAPSRGSAAMGGAIVGGVCALVGIVVSVVLGDTAPVILAIGTVSSAVTGAVGGFATSFFGKGA